MENQLSESEAVQQRLDDAMGNEHVPAWTNSPTRGQRTPVATDLDGKVKDGAFLVPDPWASELERRNPPMLRRAHGRWQKLVWRASEETEWVPGTVLCSTIAADESAWLELQQSELAEQEAALFRTRAMRQTVRNAILSVIPSDWAVRRSYAQRAARLFMFRARHRSPDEIRVIMEQFPFPIARAVFNKIYLLSRSTPWQVALAPREAWLVEEILEPLGLELADVQKPSIHPQRGPIALRLYDDHGWTLDEIKAVYRMTSRGNMSKLIDRTRAKQGGMETSSATLPSQARCTPG